MKKDQSQKLIVKRPPGYQETAHATPISLFPPKKDEPQTPVQSEGEKKG
jgi:hypothetical protein